MSGSFNLDLISNGEPVSSEVPNRPLQQLYLELVKVRNQLQATNAGSTIIARDVSVAAASMVGQPVSYISGSNSFELSKLDTIVDPQSNQLVSSPLSNVWGIVLEKKSSTVADVLIEGFIELDISNALTSGSQTDHDVFYLSSSEAGKLVSTNPSGARPVLRTTQNGEIYFVPQWQDFANQHQHVAYDLTCQPADSSYTPPALGSQVVLTSPDDSLPGWLPADDPIFNGLAPAGAVFGYNLSQDTGLSYAWPPANPGGSVLEWDRGNIANSIQTGFIQVSDNLVTIDSNGIWWMYDTYNDVPFPVDYPLPSPGPGERPTPMQMRIYFTKPSALNRQAVVSSLQSNDGRIKVLCATSNNPASYGDLKLELDMEFLLGEETATGSLVFKDYNTETKQFERGQVLEGIIAASNNVVITSSQNRLLNAAPDAPTVHQGIMTLAVDNSADRQLPVSFVKLNGASEETIGNIPYIGLPPRAAAYTAKLPVPSELQMSSPELKIVMLLVGRIVGTMPNLTLSYQVFKQPTELAVVGTEVAETHVQLPGATTALAVTTNHDTTAENQVVKIETAKFAVDPGDIIYFTLSRADVDGYNADVGVIQQYGIISGQPIDEV